MCSAANTTKNFEPTQKLLRLIRLRSHANSQTQKTPACNQTAIFHGRK